MSAQIKMDEWMAELQRLERASQGEGAQGFTRREYQVQRGVSERTAMTQMHKLLAQGLLEFAGMRRSRTVTGKSCEVPVYRVVKKQVRKGRG